jgi:N-acyl-D-aspartate/D-glutamate deacylase
MDVMIDAFPYTCGNTTILAPVPYWFLAKIPDAYSNALLKARLRLELAAGFRLLGFSYPDFQVMDSGIPGYEDLNGLRITEIAAKWGCSPFTAMLTLAEKSRGATLMLYHTYSGEPGFEDPLEKVLSRDYCLFETDAAIKANGLPNPAAMGTFPRILGRFVRDQTLFSLEDAVRRMTHASAERFGLKDVGCLAPGLAADLVLFDPLKIADNPGGNRQAAGRPEGIKRVLLNGQTVVKDGIYVEGVRPGRVLKV